MPETSEVVETTETTQAPETAPVSDKAQEFFKEVAEVAGRHGYSGVAMAGTRNFTEEDGTVKIATDSMAIFPQQPPENELGLAAFFLNMLLMNAYLETLFGNYRQEAIALWTKWGEKSEENRAAAEKAVYMLVTGAKSVLPKPEEVK